MKKFLIAVAAMVMASCATTENLPLENTQWKLLELKGDANEAFAEGDTFTFTLDGASVAGKGSVNRFFGGYEYNEAEGLKFGTMGMTRMMGPNVDLEDSFVQMFDAVTGCEVKGDILLVKDAEGNVLAKFKAWTPDPDAEVESQPLGTPVMTVDEALELSVRPSEEE